MNEHAYLLTISQIVQQIGIAIAEVAPLLPQEVRNQHWRAAQYSPDAWGSVYHWYQSTPNWQIETADLLSDLADLAMTRERLKGMLTRKTGPVVVPKLARTRRTSM